MWPSPDDDLVVRAKSGDEAAWRDLYEAHAGRLLLWLRSRPSGDAAVAFEDVAAEAWLTAAQRIADFSGNSSYFAGWLFGIARNIVLNTSRRSVRRATFPAPMDGIDRDDPVAHPRRVHRRRRSRLDAATARSPAPAGGGGRRLHRRGRSRCGRDQPGAGDHRGRRAGQPLTRARTSSQVPRCRSQGSARTGYGGVNPAPPVRLHGAMRVRRRDGTVSPVREDAPARHAALSSRE